MEKEAVQRQAETPEGQMEAPAKRSLKEKWQAMPRKKKRRRIVRWTILLLVILAVAVGAYKFFGGKKAPEAQVVTDTVQYGAITSTVEGNGLRNDRRRKRARRSP